MNYRYTKRQILEALGYWRSLLGESLYFNPAGGVCWMGGSWIGSGGEHVEVSDADAERIVKDISYMEKVNYTGVSYVGLGAAKSLDDIADYMCVDSPDDLFVFYSGQDPTGPAHATAGMNRDFSPVSRNPAYADAFYMIAAVQTFKDIVEEFDVYPDEDGPALVNLGDICGRMTRASLPAMDLLLKFIDQKNAVGFYCNARRETSNKILDKDLARTGGRSHLLRAGMVDVSPVDDGDDFVTRVFLKKAWIGSNRDTFEWMRSYIGG